MADVAADKAGVGIEVVLMVLQLLLEPLAVLLVLPFFAWGKQEGSSWAKVETQCKTREKVGVEGKGGGGGCKEGETQQ